MNSDVSDRYRYYCNTWAIISILLSYVIIYIFEANMKIDLIDLSFSNQMCHLEYKKKQKICFYDILKLTK